MLVSFFIGLIVLVAVIAIRIGPRLFDAQKKKGGFTQKARDVFGITDLDEEDGVPVPG
jgi:hypothetical protein